MLISIITPTTGNPKLRDLLESLQAQTHTHFEHLLVVDGPEHQAAVEDMLADVPSSPKRFVFQLPFATGKYSFFGHKIYAAIPQLARGQYVMFLDEDNTLEPNHLETFAARGVHHPDWMYSLRRIISQAGEFVCNDDCESLGYLRPVFYNSQDDHLIDTNCYCVKRDILIKCSHLWNRPGANRSTDPDRVLAKYLMEHHPNFLCTLQHTVNYRVGGRNEHSVQASLFLRGNQLIRDKLGDNPWASRPIAVLVAATQVETAAMVHNPPQHPLLRGHVLVNGYSKYVPYHSKVAVIDGIEPTPLPPRLRDHSSSIDRIKRQVRLCWVKDPDSTPQDALLAKNLPRCELLDLADPTASFVPYTYALFVGHGTRIEEALASGVIPLYTSTASHVFGDLKPEHQSRTRNLTLVEPKYWEAYLASM